MELSVTQTQAARACLQQHGVVTPNVTATMMGAIPFGSKYPMTQPPAWVMRAISRRSRVPPVGQGYVTCVRRDTGGSSAPGTLAHSRYKLLKGRRLVMVATFTGTGRRAGTRRIAAEVCLLSLVLLLVTSGCGDLLTREARELEGPEEGIPVEVVRGVGGTVLVNVDIFIDDQGPYTFVLDTGASRSVIDPAIAAELGLPESSRTGIVTGVTGQAEAAMVEVENWRIGEVPLPPTTVVALELPQIAGPSILGGILGDRMGEVRGLLGSDMLSEFGVVQLDYEQGVLILRPGGNEPATQP
jgi:predicted aspartyl protease